MWPKYLLLARHPESQKNVSGAFSSASGSEGLSNTGELQADALAESIHRAIMAARIAGSDILVAASPFYRAAIVAERLRVLTAAEILIDPRLKPIDSGAVGGTTEFEAKLSAPDFMHMLELYRAGVASSHRIVGYGEDLASFEARTAGMLESLLAARQRMLVVIGHRSSLTAALIWMARASLGYPSDFYGYVPLDLGSLCAIRIGAHRAMDWIAVNQDPDVVVQRVTERSRDDA